MTAFKKKTAFKKHGFLVGVCIYGEEDGTYYSHKLDKMFFVL